MDATAKSQDGRMLAVIYLIIIIDAAGMGLVLPVLPDLLRSLGGEAATGWPFGAFLGLYALMQFLFSPLLGSLSDRFGRRRILLLSLAGASINYVVMALHPSLWLLFAGRAVAGMTGANMAVASAYLADITPPDKRAERFGRLSACFGLGFIVGPALGGLMSGWGPSYPFIAAAAASLVTLVMTTVLLPRPSSHWAPVTAAEPFDFNPLSAFRWVFSFPVLAPLLGVFVVFAMIGEVGGTVWVLYGEDRFHWHGLTVGLSLGLFGLFHALAQAFLTGPLSRWLGQRGTLLMGMACDTVAYVCIALADQGWMAFLLIPLFCLGGIGAPVLEGLLSNGVADDGQGRLRGVMASLTSLASIVAPVAVAAIYFASRSWFPGLVWLLGAGLYLLCLPVVLWRGLYSRSLVG